jgi:hypothetical protein
VFLVVTQEAIIIGSRMARVIIYASFEKVIAVAFGFECIGGWFFSSFKNFWEAQFVFLVSISWY